MTRIPPFARALAFTAVCGALAAGAPAQESSAPPPSDRFGDRIEVVEALVDVLVTDRQGNVVLGLEPADFRITVEGSPAEVTGATFYSNRRFLDSRGSGGGAPDTSPVPDRRWFVLFFDDQRAESFDEPRLLSRQLEAGREAVEWLRTELQPNDYVAVAAFDVRLRLQQEFTNDLDRLIAAVDRAARGEPSPADWPSRQTPRVDVPSLHEALGEPAEVAKKTTTVRRALTTLAAALEGVPGRKNLILFSTGFGETGSQGEFISETRNREVIEALNAANTAVYGVDLVPVHTEHTFAAALSQLSNATGGRSFFDVVRFGLALAEVGRETNGYYLVSVRTAGTESGFRDVRVRVDNPEFRVRSRGGFRFEGAAGQAAPIGGGGR